MTLVFYVSGHGLGHAAREVEIINRIFDREPAMRIVVRTSAPRWFFDTFVRPPIELVTDEVDTGVFQIDGLHLDEERTARRAAEFYATFGDRVDADARTLDALEASLVVSDAPPLAIAAAARAGIAAAVVSNFTWDWIYQGYGAFDRLAPGVVDLIREAYAHSRLALRLPFHGGFESMRRVVRDVPLVARHATHPRAATRQALGLGSEEPVVLASFGGYGLALPYDDIARTGRFTLVVTDKELHTESSGPARRFAIDDLASRGFFYPDLVAAADVVISKPGYGIVSECIANGAALLYTDRGRFPEHDVFVAEMPRVLRRRFIAQNDLLEGRWNDSIDAVLAQPPPPEHLATNGADVVADAILELLEPRPTIGNQV
jgi:L-arabinokinase